jgi:hypothetical protein
MPRVNGQPNLVQMYLYKNVVVTTIVHLFEVFLPPSIL